MQFSITTFEEGWPSHGPFMPGYRQNHKKQNK